MKIQTGNVGRDVKVDSSTKNSSTVLFAVVSGVALLCVSIVALVFGGAFSVTHEGDGEGTINVGPAPAPQPVQPISPQEDSTPSQ